MTSRLVEERGFTLIELMVVVAIISLLASMAISGYYNFTCKAKQSEARESLGFLSKCQEAYFVEYDTYSSSMNRIGFYVVGTPYYTYEITSADDTGFQAEARATFRERPDKWVVDDTFSPKNEENACL